MQWRLPRPCFHTTTHRTVALLLFSLIQLLDAIAVGFPLNELNIRHPRGIVWGFLQCPAGADQHCVQTCLPKKSQWSTQQSHMQNSSYTQHRGPILLMIFHDSPGASWKETIAITLTFSKCSVQVLNVTASYFSRALPRDGASLDQYFQFLVAQHV